MEKSHLEVQETALLDTYSASIGRDSSSEFSTTSTSGDFSEDWIQDVIDDQDPNIQKESVVHAFDYNATEAIEFPKLGLHSSTGLRGTLMSLLILLLPSFILPADKSQDQPQEPSPTAWLDGLRGVGALCVLFTHYNLIFNPELRTGTNPDNTNILQWPMIRVIHSGGAAVGIFYIISGYALSFRALYLIRKRDMDNFSKSLASATFRRAFRLFIPMNISTFFAGLFVYAGWYGKGEGANGPPQLPTLWLQFKDWCHESVMLSDPLYSILVGNYPPRYDGALWTIPLEFQGSIIIFLLLLGVARTKTLVRMVIIFGLFCFCIYRQYVETVLFIGGVLISEFTLTRAFWRKRAAINLSELQMPQNRDFDITNINHIILGILFLISVYILGIPEGEENQRLRGYSTLIYLTPASYVANERNSLWFWIAVGGLLAVVTISLAPFLQRLFTSRSAIYLGKISYSLYLVHVKILYTLGWHMIPKFLAIFGHNTVTQRVMGHVVGGSLLAFVIIWAADLFSRGIDEPVVAFVRWASNKCFTL